MMSVFINIVRYTNSGKRKKCVAILATDLEAAVKKIPQFKVVRVEGQVAVQLGPGDLFAVLEDTGILSTQVFEETNSKQLLEALKKLAGDIPGAVVETEGRREL